MSNDLKLPSFIYQELPSFPTNVLSTKAVSTNELSENIKTEILNDYISSFFASIDAKVITCLDNQKNILDSLSRLEKKLEEFD